MATNINRYRADLRDMRFLLFDQFKLEEVLGKGPYKDWGPDECKMVLEEVYKWVAEVTGPLNSIGDKQGCKFDNGQVKTPDGFKKAWKSLYDVGWRALPMKEEHGGQGAPYSLSVLVDEMLSGSNTALNMYSGLTAGVAEVIETFGTEEQVKKFVRALTEGKWAGTMCLTEPQAGSDVGASATKATPNGDGTYNIVGTKIYISGGQHDLAENIIHLVLARTPDAPLGTKGLSLFMVPREKLDGSGSNDVECGSLEKKMGINGSATAVLNFGEKGNCVGELVGTEELLGMKQMFKMMNFARIGVGVQGLAVAGSAYLNALEYARDRKQGSSINAWKDPKAPKVAIVEHPNVRRLLIDMKSRVEGIRALIVKLSVHIDRMRLCEEGSEEAAYHQGQVDLLVPLVKAYASDQGFNVTVAAVQVFGGAGYLKDHPVEQYCRDAKIFSIYEGTNHIQALDLVGRKLGQKGGANFQAYLKDMGGFVKEHRDHPVLGDAVKLLGDARKAVSAGAMQLLGWFQSGKMQLVPLNANRYLEMMAATTVGWMLLEGAVIADAKANEIGENHKDYNFYVGRRYSAQFFASNELPGVGDKGDFMSREDLSPMEIPDEGLGTM